MARRRITRPIAVAACGTLAALAAIVGGGWWRLFRRPMPQTKGEIEIGGIEAPLEIARDRWGVPHVRAQSEFDMWFGQGFCHGQDRLWQIEIQRRITAGRLCEIGGEDALPLDRLMRTLGFYRLALREEDELDPALRAKLDAYCAGVNTAAAQRPVLPAEFQILRIGFEPYRPADMLAGSKLFAFGLSTNWERELLRADMVRGLGSERAAALDPAYPRGNPIVTTPGSHWEGDGLALADQIARVRELIGLGAGAGGSNNWAVSGKLTASGNPLIAGDPHLPPGMPGIWYQVSLEANGRFCRGASLPGLPGAVIGQNNDVVWTFTNALADTQDLFVERIEGDRYLFEDRWLPLEEITEAIVVKGRSEPVIHTVRLTHHGPIVNEALGADESEPLALKWTALEMPAIGDAQVAVLDPRSGTEFVETVSTVTMPVSNLVWADSDGHIGYKTMGRIPVRRGHCPDLPKPGWTGEFEWEGMVPYDQLPEVVDPEAGYLVTANNRIEADDFRHHIGSDHLDGYRARRIEDLLLTGSEHEIDDFERFQVDVRSIPGEQIVHQLARLKPQGQRETRAIEILKSWDHRLDVDSVAATIYQAFNLRLAREFARTVIGDRDLAARWLDRSGNAFTAQISNFWRWQSYVLGLWIENDHRLLDRPWHQFAADALRGALDDLERDFGPDPSTWRWGRAHTITFKHALGGANPIFARIFNRQLPLGGGQETPLQATFDANDPFHTAWAPSYRIVADPTDPDRSRWQTFTGQSGHVASPHYDDLQQRWLQGRTQAMTGEGPWRRLRLLPAASSASPPGAAGPRAG